MVVRLPPPKAFSTASAVTSLPSAAMVFAVSNSSSRSITALRAMFVPSMSLLSRLYHVYYYYDYYYYYHYREATRRTQQRRFARLPPPPDSAGRFQQLTDHRATELAPGTVCP